MVPSALTTPRATTAMNTAPITPIKMSGVGLTEGHNISAAAPTTVTTQTMKSAVFLDWGAVAVRTSRPRGWIRNSVQGHSRAAGLIVNRWAWQGFGPTVHEAHFAASRPLTRR